MFTQEQQNLLIEMLSGLNELYRQRNDTNIYLVVCHVTELIKTALNLEYSGGSGVGIITGWVDYFKEIEEKNIC